MDKQKKKKNKNTSGSLSEGYSETVLTASDVVTVNEIVEVSPSIASTPAQITIGQYLRESREKKHLSLKNISLHTKISLSTLENIESNNFKGLPSRPYTLGFVKAYAKTLGLNLLETQKILDATYTEYLDKQSHFQKLNIKQNTAKNPSYRYITPYLVWGLFTIVGVSSISMFFKKSTRDSDTVQEIKEKIVPQVITEKTPLVGQEAVVAKEVVAVTAAPNVINVAKAVNTPENEKTLNLTELKIKETKLLNEIEKNAEKVPVAESPKIKEELQKKLMAQEIKEEFTPIPTPVFSYIAESTDQKSYSYLPSNVKASFVKGIENVYVVAATADTWITYKKDGDPIKKFILKKERSVLIRGNNIRIFLGNANATKIFLNNQLVDTQTKTGVKSLVFPEINVSKYVLPLFIYKENGEVLTSEDYLNSLSR